MEHGYFLLVCHKVWLISTRTLWEMTEIKLIAVKTPSFNVGLCLSALWEVVWGLSGCLPKHTHLWLERGKGCVFPVARLLLTASAGKRLADMESQPSLKEGCVNLWMLCRQVGWQVFISDRSTESNRLMVMSAETIFKFQPYWFLLPQIYK